jgi:hypothetical protein
MPKSLNRVPADAERCPRPSFNSPTAGDVRDLHIERQALLFRYAKHEHKRMASEIERPMAPSAAAALSLVPVSIRALTMESAGMAVNLKFWAKRMVDIPTGEACDREPTSEERGKDPAA